MQKIFLLCLLINCAFSASIPIKDEVVPLESVPEVKKQDVAEDKVDVIAPVETIEEKQPVINEEPIVARNVDQVEPESVQVVHEQENEIPVVAADNVPVKEKLIEIEEKSVEQPQEIVEAIKLVSNEDKVEGVNSVVANVIETLKKVEPAEVVPDAPIKEAKSDDALPMMEEKPMEMPKEEMKEEKEMMEMEMKEEMKEEPEKMSEMIKRIDENVETLELVDTKPKAVEPVLVVEQKSNVVEPEPVVEVKKLDDEEKPEEKKDEPVEEKVEPKTLLGDESPNKIEMEEKLKEEKIEKEKLEMEKMEMEKLKEEKIEEKIEMKEELKKEEKLIENEKIEPKKLIDEEPKKDEKLEMKDEMKEEKKEEMKEELKKEEPAPEMEKPMEKSIQPVVDEVKPVVPEIVEPQVKSEMAKEEMPKEEKMPEPMKEEPLKLDEPKLEEKKEDKAPMEMLKSAPAADAQPADVDEKQSSTQAPGIVASFIQNALQTVGLAPAQANNDAPTADIISTARPNIISQIQNGLQNFIGGGTQPATNAAAPAEAAADEKPAEEPAASTTTRPSGIIATLTNAVNNTLNRPSDAQQGPLATFVSNLLGTNTPAAENDEKPEKPATPL